MNPKDSKKEVPMTSYFLTIDNIILRTLGTNHNFRHDLDLFAL